MYFIIKQHYKNTNRLHKKLKIYWIYVNILNQIFLYHIFLLNYCFHNFIFLND